MKSFERRKAASGWPRPIKARSCRLDCARARPRMGTAVKDLDRNLSFSAKSNPLNDVD